MSIYGKLSSTIIILLTILLIGCATTSGTSNIARDHGTHGSNVSIDELCILEIVGGIHVRQFSGITVGDPSFMGETALAGWGVKGTTANRRGSDARAIIQRSFL